mmetsp:Transcript_73726/g.207746  ORF Transcript_73726/g.207746 Transcript_73726/m.207746 type:complete len:83 (+) Transcript_73726:36-284(+)
MFGASCCWCANGSMPGLIVSQCTDQPSAPPDRKLLEKSQRVNQSTQWSVAGQKHKQTIFNKHNIISVGQVISAEVARDAELL